VGIRLAVAFVFVFVVVLIMSSSSSSSAVFPLDHLAAPSPTEQLCYVHCNCCDTILAVRAVAPIELATYLPTAC
jgi:hypothetical protein